MTASSISRLPSQVAMGLFAAVATLVAVPLPAGGGPAIGNQTGSCDEPFAPVYGYRAAPSAGPVTQTWPGFAVVAPRFGQSPFDHQQQLSDAGFDADGDGERDVAYVDPDGGQEVIVARGDGEVRLGLAGHLVATLDGTPLGDLDADGRDEILVLARPAEGGPDRVFVVPGTTAAGSHRLDEVAIAVPRYQVMPAGDRVDGPGHDLAVPLGSSSPGTAIVSGDAVMAAGPGGTATFEAWGEPLDGYPVGVFDLDDGEISLVTITDGTGGGSPIALALHRGGTVTRFASPAELPFPQPPYRVAVVADNGRRFLVAGHADRGGSTGFYWDVDEPCRQLPRSLLAPVVEGPPPAAPPAARPVPGAATFTG